MLPRNVTRRVAVELREIYGDPDEAKEAVEQIVSEPQVMEAWAARTLGEPFKWDGIPGAQRESLIVGMAMAYLVSTSKEAAA